MGQMDCTSEQVLVIYGGKRTVELMGGGTMVQTEFSSTRGLQAGAGRFSDSHFTRRSLTGRPCLFSCTNHCSCVSAAAQAQNTFSLLVAGKLQLRVQSPAQTSPSKVKSSSLPLEGGSYNIYCSLNHCFVTCLYLSLPLDCELLKGRDQGLFFLLTIPVPTTGPDAQ